MLTDVKSAYTATSAALVPFRTRLKSVYFVVTAGGPTPVTFYDNASAASGNVLLQIGCTVAVSGTAYIPAEGILAQNGIYCDVGSAASVTVFYG